MTNGIYCGDCLDVMRGMEVGSVDLIYADPPFGTGKDFGDLLADYKWRLLGRQCNMDWACAIHDLLDFTMVFMVKSYGGIPGSYMFAPRFQCRICS